jgi:hypothetical protein
VKTKGFSQQRKLYSFVDVFTNRMRDAKTNNVFLKRNGLRRAQVHGKDRLLSNRYNYIRVSDIKYGIVIALLNAVPHNFDAISRCSVPILLYDICAA